MTRRGKLSQTLQWLHQTITVSGALSDAIASQPSLRQAPAVYFCDRICVILVAASGCKTKCEWRRRRLSIDVSVIVLYSFMTACPAGGRCS